MPSEKATTRHLPGAVETLSPRTGRRPETPAYGSWLLGRVSESPRMRRVRIQGMLTVAILVTNVIGLIVGAMLLTVAFPKPSVILDAPHWVSFGIVPGY